MNYETEKYVVSNTNTINVCTDRQIYDPLISVRPAQNPDTASQSEHVSKAENGAERVKYSCSGSGAASGL